MEIEIRNTEVGNKIQFFNKRDNLADLLTKKLAKGKSKIILTWSVHIIICVAPRNPQPGSGTCCARCWCLSKRYTIFQAHVIPPDDVNYLVGKINSICFRNYWMKFSSLFYAEVQTAWSLWSLSDSMKTAHLYQQTHTDHPWMIPWQARIGYSRFKARDMPEHA